MEVLTNKSLFCLQTSGREARLGSLRKDVAFVGSVEIGNWLLVVDSKERENIGTYPP